MAKSLPKGKRYERRVVQLLSDFTKEKFRRVPSSGAFNKTGGVVVAEHIFSGDVICNNKDFLFNVEAKNRKDISLTALLKSPKTATLTKCWKQCVGDADSTGLFPIMFFKPNAQDDCICLDLNHTRRMGLQNLLRLEVYINSADIPNMVILNWKEFIAHSDPDVLFPYRQIIFELKNPAEQPCFKPFTSADRPCPVVAAFENVQNGKIFQIPLCDIDDASELKLLIKAVS